MTTDTDSLFPKKNAPSLFRSCLTNQLRSLSADKITTGCQGSPHPVATFWRCPAGQAKALGARLLPQVHYLLQFQVAWLASAAR